MNLLAFRKVRHTRWIYSDPFHLLIMEGPSGYREDFERCLNEAFIGISKAAFQGEELETEAALDCYNQYFQVMMGATDLVREDVDEAVAYELGRQQELYNTLRTITTVLDGEIMGPGRVFAEPHWDFGLTSGCNLRVGSGYLYAVPLVPAATGSWGALVQAPVAAYPIYIGGGLVLLRPVDQSFESEGSEALENLIGEYKDVTGDVAGCWDARVGGGFLFVDTGDPCDETVLWEWIEEYGVHAVVKVNSSEFSGYIFTGFEDRMPKLHRRIFFEWRNNTLLYAK